MKSRKTSIAAKLAIIVFVIFSLVTVFKLKIELDDLNREYEQLEAQIKEKENYIKILKNRLESASGLDENYVEEVAKDKLNLVLPEEIIFYNDITG